MIESSLVLPLADSLAIDNIEIHAWLGVMRARVWIAQSVAKRDGVRTSVWTHFGIARLRANGQEQKGCEDDEVHDALKHGCAACAQRDHANEQGQ